MKKLLFFIVLGAVMQSCHHDDKSAEITYTAEAKTQAQFLFSDVLRTAIYQYQSYISDQQAAGMAVSIDVSPNLSDSNYPKVFTIDFGASNQPDFQGIKRKGKLIVQLNSSDGLNGDFSIKFENYYVNDSRLLGLFNYSNNGTSGLNNFTATFDDSTKIVNNNGTMAWGGSNVSMDFEQTDGDTTVDVYDDVYSFSETSEGEDFKGVGFTSTTTTDLTADFSCRWIFTEGVVELTPEGKEKQTLTYSDACDGIVSLVTDDEKGTLYFGLDK